MGNRSANIITRSITLRSKMFKRLALGRFNDLPRFFASYL